MLAPSPSGAACSCTPPPNSQIDVEISSNQIAGCLANQFCGPKLARMPSVLQDASLFGPAPSRTRRALGLDASLLS